VNTLPRLLTAAAWGFALLLLAVNLPGYLCMGIDCDPAQFDMLARSVARGSVPYRDVCEVNFPGMLWLHLAVRGALGWSPEVLRAVDITVLTGAVLLLAIWLPGLSRPARGLVAALLFAFYLSTSEWCHCQRDPWALAIVLLALCLRYAQARRIGEGTAGGAKVWAYGFLEGLVWGAAFWVKPYVIVPAAAAWLWSAREVLARGGRPARGRVLADALAVLAGGAAAGGVGVGWLVASGAWPYFAQMMFDWSRDYLAPDRFYRGTPRWEICIFFALRNQPWCLAYLTAIPYAISLLAQPRGTEASFARSLLSALFLGWLLQAVMLQHCLDYVHTPALLLALTLTADLACTGSRTMRWAAGGLLVVMAVFGHLGAVRQRVELLPRCVAEGSTPELSDRLGRLHRMSYTDLEQVAVFLEGEGVRDRELTCFDLSSQPLPLRLGITPSTRYTFLQSSLICFHSHRGEIKAAIAASPVRFIVCDFTTLDDLPPDSSPDGTGVPPLPERWEKPYPWKDYIIFRSGRYLVLRLDGEQAVRWLTECMGL
jgi:hypothetical protein